MNRNLLIILALLSLAAIAFYLIKGKPSEKGFDISDREFKIENTEDIATLSIERKKYPAVIFSKKGSKWYLNSGREARPEATENIFSLLRNLKIKYIPNENGSENIKKSIAEVGIHVRAYDKNDKLMKSFFVGPDLGDGTGTGFLMEGAKQAFVMFSNGFTGSIRTRFVFDRNEYESKNIFVEDPLNIKKIEVKYPYDKPSSYAISRTFSGFDFVNPYSGAKLPALNEQFIEPYLTNFSKIIAEYNDAGNENKEMILQQPIFCEINLERKDGSKRSAKFYSLPNIEFKENKYSPKEISPDTRFMVHTDKDEMFLIQLRAMQKALTSFDRFAKR
jgi:hypothetical protein